MAKAGGKSITWIFLSEAKALVEGRYHSSEFAKRRILEGLAVEKIRWCCLASEGAELNLVGRPEFWREGPPSPSGERHDVQVNWAESSAYRLCGAGITQVFGIRVARAGVLALLPPDDVDGDDSLAKVWVPRVARELKRAGKLDHVTKKIQLADRILKAGVAAGRDKVDVDYIRDIVEELGVWPVSKIKI